MEETIERFYAAFDRRDGEDMAACYAPDARFSDGHRVTSEDVIATYNLGMDAAILSPSTNSFFAGFEKPVAIKPPMLSARAIRNQARLRSRRSSAGTRPR